MDTRERITVITLNRPDNMNAVNSVMRHELADALQCAEHDPDIDVLILTGAGRAFSAGLDLKQLERDASDTLAKFPSVWDQLRQFPKPTIAAVNGFAITGGMELALCCDILIASEEAMFADTHARVGILPGGGMTQILPRLVGLHKAKELSFTGNFLSAKEALQWGLVNRIVPRGELLDAARSLAADIVNNDQVAVRKIKQIMNRGEGMALDDAIRMEQFEHLCHRSQGTAREVKRRRTGIMERGRRQAKN